MEIDVLVEDERWAVLGLEALARDAVAATLDHLDIDAEATELSVLACDNARIAGLNTEFRDKPGPTNVLSWPAEDLAPEHAGKAPQAPSKDPDGTIPLGDVAIAYETCAREATEAGKMLAHHVSHLLVHGTLHLLGYDHVRDPDATLMQGIETKILGKMGLDDPYRE